jgi:hypothetical protein
MSTKSKKRIYPVGGPVIGPDTHSNEFFVAPAPKALRVDDLPELLRDTEQWLDVASIISHYFPNPRVGFLEALISDCFQRVAFALELLESGKAPTTREFPDECRDQLLEFVATNVENTRIDEWVWKLLLDAALRGDWRTAEREASV